MNFFYNFIFFCLSFLSSLPLVADPASLKINLITHVNIGKGLDTDVNVLRSALDDLGCAVTVLDFHDTNWSRAHINIFLQKLIPEKFPMAMQNWMIPNPEWYQEPLALLDRLDLILCRTREVERIFNNLKKPTYFLGFTSPDCYKEGIKKNYRRLLHLAGGSEMKGSDSIKNIWYASPNLPLLTVVKFLSPYESKKPNFLSISERLPEEKVRYLQNRCGIHLCPSETEGFGHYIMEAMSTGAVVVTTNAPPMNEFIHHASCLVPYNKKGTHLLANWYGVDPKELKTHIKALLRKTNEELSAIGKDNREIYLQKKEEFLERLKDLILIAEPLTQKKI